MDCVIQILLADNNSYYMEHEESSNTFSIKKLSAAEGKMRFVSNY